MRDLSQGSLAFPIADDPVGVVVAEEVAGDLVLREELQQVLRELDLLRQRAGRQVQDLLELRLDLDDLRVVL